MNERFSFPGKRARAQKARKPAAARFTDMLMELEQRIAFDAAAGEHVEAAADRHAAPEPQAKHEFSALAKALESRGTTNEKQPTIEVGEARGAGRGDGPAAAEPRPVAKDEARSLRVGDLQGKSNANALDLGLKPASDKVRASLDIADRFAEKPGAGTAGGHGTRDSHRGGASEESGTASRHAADAGKLFADTAIHAGSDPAANAHHEIVFVVGDIEDLDTLIADFGKTAEVVILDPTKDGVEQIAAALKGRTGIDAIHIVSHGGEGQLELGTALLNASSMQGEYLDELTAIGHALSANGDILIYGCDFTAGDAGLKAAMILGGITGADIAASTDTTGHADLGGDWDLETHTGVIDTSAIDASDWQHALVQTTINSTGGTQTNGSDGLRIYVGSTGQLQVTYKNLTQFYGPTVTDTATNLYNGIFLAYGNRILGPSTGVTTIVDTVWQSAGAQTLTGAGTEANPYIVTTRLFYNIGGGTGYDAGTDLLVEVQTVYAYPNAYFTENVTVTPPTSNTQVIKYYHTLDTYLAGGDNGPAFSLDPSLAINNNTTGDPSYVGVRKGIGTATEAIVGFAEVEGSRQFDRYYSAVYNGMYASMDNGGDMTNTWNTSPSTDNGIAVQFTLGAVATPQTFSYRIAFDGKTSLDLDANNSTATGTSYAGTFQATTGSQVSVVDTDVDIVNVIGGIADATVTLTTPQSGDVLTVDEAALPAGITVTVHSAYSVTIAGVADAAAYEAALQAIKFSTTSGVTSTRSFTVAVHNQLNSVTTTATATLSGNFSPIVDLNSGLSGVVETNNVVTNGDFADYADVPYGWTEGGTGASVNSAITGRYAFTNTSADTLTQSGLTGLNVGPAPSGAGQVTLDLGWVNTGSDRTMTIQVGGVTYATLNTATGALTYANGATNASGGTSSTITAMASASGAMTSIVINLPSSVAATGSLVFSATSGVDDIYIDTVRLRTNITSMIDQTAGSNWNATFTENGAAVSIADTDNDVRDGDSANMASGAVTLTNAQSGDRLLVNGSAAASGTVNGIAYTNTGTVITLAGSATKANYAAAIRAITFENTTDNPGAVTRDITVQVNDGSANSNVAHAYITVVPTNDAPTDGNETNTVTEDTTLTVAGPGVLANATDPDGDTLTVSQFVWNGTTYSAGVTATIAGVGQLTINANGGYSFVPAANFTGTIPVATYTVSDGKGGTDTSTLTLSMVALNDAPAGADKAVTINEDTAYTFAAADFGFTDPNDSPANAFESVVITTLPASGTLRLNGVAVTAGQMVAVADIPLLTYTPPANGNGNALSSFTFQVRDNGGTANGGQNTDQTPNTITFNVTAVNDAPAGADKTIAATEDTAYSFTAADFGFTDPNDSPANTLQSVIVTTLPATGTLRLNGVAVTAGQEIPAASIGLLTYTPAANAAGNALASFTFQVRDNGGTANGGQDTDQTPNTITFNVAAVNDAPVNTLPAQSGNEDSGISLTGLSVADVDAGSGNIQVTLSVPSGQGTLAATAGGGVTVTGSGSNALVLTGTLANINAYLAAAGTRPVFQQAVADFNGTVALTMTTSDLGNTGTGGAQTDSDTVQITIAPVVDIANDTATTNEDVAVAVSPFANDSFENAGRAVTAINGSAIVAGGAAVAVTNGTVALSADGNTLTFTPALNYNGPASFTYTVTSGGVTETATVNVTVNAVNDAPVNTAPASYTKAEDDGALQLTGLSISDADAGSGTMTVTLSVPSGSGTFTAAGSGGVTVAGSTTNSLTLTGTQAAINAYLASGSAPSFVQVADFNGTVNVTMSTSDGGNTGTGGTLTAVTVVPVNISAVADIVGDTIAAVEDTAITFNVITGTNGASADSFENAGRIVSGINGAAFTPGTPIAITGGSITVATDGTVTFTPNADYNGSTSFTYRVTSGGVSETATVTINVAAQNDAPVNTVPGIQTTAEDTALAISGISVSDIDSSTLTTTLTVPAGAGTLAVTGQPGATVTGSGTATVQISGTAAQVNAVLATLIYTPTADFNNGPAGSFNLGIATSDGALTATSSVSVRVTPVADIVNDAVQTSEDTPVSFNVLTGAGEVSGADNFEGARTVTAINGSAFAAGSPIAVTGGSITVQPDGSVVFTPNANFSGSTTFTYSVSAGGGSTPAETATVTITTNPVNDAPVNSLPGSYSVAEDAPLKLTGLSVADVDAGSGTMTVTLSVPGGSGTLTATGSGGVAVSGSGTNALVLTGTLSDINAWLGSAAAPNYVQVADFNGAVMLTMTSNDGGSTGSGGALTDTDTVVITIAPVADIANDSVSTNEDVAVAITPLANDSFENAGRQITAINGTAITAGGAAVAVANGTVAMAADGVTLTFTPSANYNGPASFTYTVASGGVTETATINVTVNAVNDAPVNAHPASWTTPEDTPLQLTGLSISDVDAGSSSVTVTLSVPNGTGTLQATAGGGVAVAGAGTGSITLTGTVAAINTYLASASAPVFTQAQADFNGTVQLTMVTNDGGASGGGALTDTDTVAINITPVADIQADSVSTNEDTNLSFNVITGAGGASADSFEGTPVVTAINGAAFTPGLPIAIAGGTITVQANGTVLFDPSPNYNGTTGFTYTVTSGGVTETAAVTVTVVADNDAPVVASPIADQAANDSDPVTLNVSGNFTDVDNPTLSYSATGLPAGLTINPATGVISGTIAASASVSGPYTVTVTATDAGGLSVSDSFTWTVANPVPTAANDTATVTEDITLTVPAASGLIANDVDPDGDTLVVTSFTLAGNATIFTAGQTATIAGVGALTINADGSYSFVPAPNYHGGVPVATYTVSDGQGGSDTATLTLAVAAVDDTLTVGGIGDGPVAGSDAEVSEGALPGGTDPTSTGENAGGTFTITTADGVTSLSVGGTVISYAALQASGTTPIAIATAHGTVTINGYDAATGTVSYSFVLTSAANHSGGQVIEPISVVLTDGDGDTATGTLGILINDDAPVGKDDADATINVAGNPSSRAGGNVLTGADNPFAPDADPADGSADLPGADGGLTVTAVGIGAAAPMPGNVGAVIAGSYGTFTLDAAGDYLYTPDYGNPAVAALIPPATLTDTFTYVLRDADGSTATATVTITINGTPTILGLGDGSVAGTDGNVLESDLPGGSNAAGNGEFLTGEFRAIAGQHGMNSITVAGRTVTNAELLALATTPVSVATTNGSITLTGYNAASGEITYTYTLTAPVTHPASGIVTDDIALSVRDGLGNVSNHTLRVNIVDDVPAAGNDTAAVTEDDVPNTASGTVLANDRIGADANATPVTAVGAGTGAPSGAPGSTVNGTYGTLVLNADGSYVYTLDNSRPATNALTEGQVVTETFTYQVTDADGDATTATLTVTVTGNNDAPTVATPIADQSSQDGAPVSLNISGAFADIDSPVLTYALAPGSQLPAGLVLNAATGEISGTIDHSASQGGVGGVYAVTIVASDGQGGSVQNTFNWSVGNPAPTAVNDSLTVAENSVGSGNVLGNDSDPDGDTLGVVGVGLSATPTGGVGAPVAGSNGGQFTVAADGSYSFNPGTSFDDLAPGQQRTTTVNYRISDGEGGFSVATITVTVNGANDAPVAVNDVVSAAEDTNATGNVLANDTDIDTAAAGLEVRSFTVAGDATVHAAGSTATIAGVGSIVINADGSYVFTPVPNYNGTVPVITYTMADGPVSNPGSLTDDATLSITFTPQNDAPDAVNDTRAVVEDTPATGNVLTNDSDIDGDALVVSGFTIGATAYPAGGTATMAGVGTFVLNANGAYTFTPAPDYNGPVPVVTYTVSDGHGGVDSATLTLGPVSPVNDAPVAANDAFATDQNTAVSGNLFANNGSGVDVDVDDPLNIGLVNGATLVSGSTITLPSGALLTLNANGTFSYDPNHAFDSLPEGQTATDSFTYTLRDPSGATSTATVTLTVTGLDDAISITGLNDGPNGTDGAVNESDLPVIGSTPAGTGEVVSGTLTLTAVDGIGALTVNGTPVTVFPTPGNPVVFTGAYGIMRVTAFNAATGVLNYEYTLTQPANQSLGNVSDDFAIVLTDRDGDTVSGTLAIQVNDDQPTANPDANSIGEDAAAPATGNVLANDVLGADRAGGAVSGVGFGAATGTVGSALAGSYGSLTLNADGSYSYAVDTANPAVQGLQQGQTLTETFSYTYRDGDGDTVTSTLTITIDGQNDAPVAANDSVAVTEDTAATGNVLTNDTDADGDPLTVTGFEIGGTNYAAGTTATISGVGTLVVNANGAFTFTPALNYNGAVPAVTYTVSDGHGGTDTATLTLGPVSPVNDAPANIVPGPRTVGEDAGAVPITGVSIVDPDVTQVVTTVLTIPPSAGALSATGGSYNAATGTLTITGTPAQVNAALATLTHTPLADFNTGGSDFTVTMVTNDGVAAPASSTFTIAVTPVADIVADTVTADEDTPLTFDPLHGTAGSQADNFENPGAAITAITQPGIGSAVLNGDGTITYTPPLNFNGSTTMTYTVTSGGVTETATITINVADLNDAPVAANDSAPVTEDTPATGNVLTNDTDADGDPLTVTGFAIGGTNYAAGTTATIPGVGTLVINANGAFTFTPAANYNGAVPVVTYTVSDGNGGTDTATLTLGPVSPVNDAPVAANDSVPVAEDIPATGNVLTNDTDVDGDTLTVTGFAVGGTNYAPGSTATLAGVGTLVVNTDGTFTFTPVLNYNGPVPVVTYTVSDGHGGTGSATLTLGPVTPVNDAPVAGNDSAPVTEDTAATGNVLTNDTDADGDALTVTGFSVGGTNYAAGTTATISGVGTLVINANGAFTFTPAPNYNGPVPVVTYTISDGHGGTDTATLTLGPVTPVNDAPVAGNDVVAVTEDTPATGNVLANDTDVDGDTLTVTGFAIGGTNYAAGATATIAGVGTLVVNTDGTFIFTPVLNYNGPVPVATYTVSDGNGGTDSATLTLGPVTPVNDAPVAANDSAPVTEDTPATGNVLTNDTDADGDALTVTGFAVGGTNYAPGSTATLAGVGTLVVNANGAFTFTPAANYNGAVPVVTYTVSDGHGGTDTATLTLGPVSPVNDAPVAAADTLGVTEDTAATGNVLANDTDVDDDTLTVTGFAVGGTNYAPGATATITGVGTLVVNADGTFTFTPILNYNGPVPVVIYTVSDGHGGTDSATLTLGPVIPGNDAPVAGNDTFPVVEDVPATGNVLANDTDPDGDPLTVSGFSVGGTNYAPGSTAAIPGVGTLVINANGAFTFTPVANYNGPVPVVTYTVSDGHGGTDTATLTLGPVSPVNDAPVAGNDVVAVTEDTPATGNVLTNDTDADGNPLTVTGFDIGGAHYAPGTTATIPGVGTLVVNANGSFAFTPAPNYNGPVPVVTYTVSDGHGGTDSATLTLGPVSPVNDAPTAHGDTAAVKGGETVRIPVLANDGDVDGDPLRIVAIDGVPVTVGTPIAIAHGTITVNADGTVSFTPDIGYSGPVGFSYTVSDGNGGFDTASVSVDVRAGYIEGDPPAVPEYQPVELLPELSADGMVLDAVGDLHGTTLAARGMIDGVANSIRSLNGVSGLAAEGLVGQAVHQVDRWLYGEERLTDLDGLLEGGSSIDAPQGRDGTWFAVDTVLRDGVVQISILSTDGRAGAAAGRSVTLGDGRALPGWIEMDRGGMLIGRPPAGQTFLDLKIQAVDDDNRAVAETVRIDLATGVVVSHAAEQHTDAGPLLFSSQTTLGMEAGAAQANSLAAALSLWSGLRDETRVA